MPYLRHRLFYCLLIATALPAYASDPITVKLQFEPDPDNGRYVFEVCARCHLPEAWGNQDGTYPQLAGQHINVLMKQLLDIREGRRDNPAMQPFVQQRTIGGYQNLADVVAYISTLPMTPRHAEGPWSRTTPQYAEGAKLYKANCASCHGEHGEGDNAAYYPRLQGQHFPYMMRQAELVRRGLRTVDPAMKAIFKVLSDEDLEKVLNYVSHLPVPEKDLAPSPAWRNPDFQ
jgi:cytochrome c553